MGLARALGFDLCPRLSHLRDRRLHVPQQHTVPAELIAVTDRDVRMDLIGSIWDEFVSPPRCRPANALRCKRSRASVRRREDSRYTMAVSISGRCSGRFT